MSNVIDLAAFRAQRQAPRTVVLTTDPQKLTAAGLEDLIHARSVTLHNVGGQLYRQLKDLGLVLHAEQDGDQTIA